MQTHITVEAWLLSQGKREHYIFQSTRNEFPGKFSLKLMHLKVNLNAVVEIEIHWMEPNLNELVRHVFEFGKTKKT